MGGSELRTGTSRFLEQRSFIFYKLAMAAYFVFWAVYWPRFEGFREQAVHQLTFWTWDICTGYFIISAVAALLCWRAMAINDGPVTAPPPPASPQEQNVQPVRAGQASRNNLPVQAPSATTPSTQAATASSTGAGSLAQRCSGLSPVPWGLRWLQLLLWNIACIVSLIVTLVWIMEDYVRQVQQGVTNFDIQAHGLMGFFMLVDQLLIADEFKLKHIVISQVYGAVYVVFSIFWYYMAPEEDKYLYEDRLDWERNRVQACTWAVMSIGVIVPLVALVHFSLCRLREALHGRFQDERAATLERQASPIVETQRFVHC